MNTLRDLAKRFFNNFFGARGTVIEALHLMTAQLFEVGQLFFGFHAFGDNIQFQAVGHGNNGIHDAGLVAAAADIPDKRLIDFQSVDWQPIDVIQG